MRSAPLVVVVVTAMCSAACRTEPAGVPTFDGECDDLAGPMALVGVDAVSGAVRWEHTTLDASGAAVAGDVVAAAGPSGVALGIDVVEGGLLWCRDLGRVPETGNVPRPSFASAAGVLATTTGDGAVVAVDPHTGDDLWRADVGVLEGAVVVGAGDRFELWDAEAARTVARRSFEAATGAEVTDAPEPPEIRLEASGVPGGIQRQRLRVVDPSGSERWSAVVPALVAELHGDLVVTIDQTGGTGELADDCGPRDGAPCDLPDTVVAAYDASTGARRWATHVPLAGFFTVPIDDLVVLPGGDGLLALDRTDGGLVWNVDVGSPGRGGRHSEPGGVTFIAAAASDPTLLVVAVRAEEPYRD